jgi:hypothetical protein
MKTFTTKFIKVLFMVTAMSLPATSFAQLGCPAPNGLTSSNITLFTADLDWNTSMFSSGFIVEIRPAGTNFWIPVPVQQPPFTMPALLCGTDYEWRVTAICTIGPLVFPSNPSAVQTFTTQSCSGLCPPPTATTSTNVTETTADLSWTSPFPPLLTDFNLRYRESGAVTWTDVPGLGTSYQLMGLTCNTTYEWEVQTICPNPFGNPLLGPWTATETFTTSSCPPPPTPVCDPPTALASSSISLYSASITWTNAAAPGATYQLRYRIAGTANWTLLTNVSSPYSLMGLTCNTNIEWQLRTECPTTPVMYSSWSLIQSFTTAGCATPCPAPVNLTASGIDLQSANLSWTATATPPVVYQLRYRLLGTSAWTLVNNVTSPYQVTGLDCKSDYEWQVRTNCNISGSNVNSAWTNIATFATLDCNSYCPGPIAISTTNITLTGAVFNWNVQAPLPVTFQMRYRLVSAPSWTLINNAVSPYSVTSLSCGSDYVWQVRTVCGASSGLPAFYSPWSTLQFYSTLACNASCPEPVSMSTSNIGLYSASLNWSLNVPASVGFDIRYRLAGTVVWTQVNNVTSPYTVSMLTCNTNYEWEVRTVCGNNVSTDPFSPWTATQTFTTNACTFACQSPIGLSATNITDQSADLNWIVTQPGPVGYQLRYRRMGTAAWTFFSSATNPFNATGLNCGSDYQWQVRTNCSTPGNTSYSAWSSLSNFTTSSCRTTQSTFENENTSSLTLFPNPADQQINLVYILDGAFEATIEVRDMMGRLVHQESSAVDSGRMEKVLETENWINGLYMVTISSGNQVKTSRLVIQR